MNERKVKAGRKENEYFVEGCSKESCFKESCFKESCFKESCFKESCFKESCFKVSCFKESCFKESRPNGVCSHESEMAAPMRMIFGLLRVEN